jgi:hypothetical protein
MQAYFRAAKAALDLKEFEQARTVCRQGMQKQPDFPELAGVLKVGMAAVATTPTLLCCRIYIWQHARTSATAEDNWRSPLAQDVDAKEAAALQQQRQAMAEQQAVRAPAKALAAMLLSRGWRIGQPEISVGRE